MKKLISIVLIFTCLCLGACKSNIKCRELNPMYYSQEELMEYLGQHGYVTYEDVDREVEALLQEEPYYSQYENDDFYTQKSKLSALYEKCFREVSEDYICNKYICYVEEFDAYFHLFLIDSERYGAEHSGPGFDNYPWSYNPAQGLRVEVKVMSEPNDYSDSDVLDKQFQQMLIGLYRSTDVDTVIDEGTRCEISKDTLMYYYSEDVYDEAFYEIYGDMDHQNSYYRVFIVSINPETKARVSIMYTIPEKDNEEEVQELRDLGLPVVTDFN